MSKTSNQIQKLTILALFLAIEIILLVTPLGYLRIGVLSATLMHIPVIVCACTMGVKYGVFMGVVFGVTSVINATMAPTVTSFVFSPFVTIGGMSGGWQSLIVALVPRVLIGLVSGLIYQWFTKKGKTKSLSAGLAAFGGTAINTIGVLGLIIVFYSSSYAEAIGVAQDALIAAFGTVVLTNTIPEIVLAIACNMAIVKALGNRK